MLELHKPGYFFSQCKQSKRVFCHICGRPNRRATTCDCRGRRPVDPPLAESPCRRRQAKAVTSRQRLEARSGRPGSIKERIRMVQVCALAMRLPNTGVMCTCPYITTPYSAWWTRALISPIWAAGLSACVSGSILLSTNLLNPSVSNLLTSPQRK
jgi:hypothetical protein